MAFKTNGNRRTFTSTSKKPSQDQISDEIGQLAYQYYVDRGYQSGNDMDDWLRAERTVKAKYNVK